MTASLAYLPFDPLFSGAIANILNPNCEPRVCGFEDAMVIVSVMAGLAAGALMVALNRRRARRAMESSRMVERL